MEENRGKDQLRVVPASTAIGVGRTGAEEQMGPERPRASY